MHLFDVFHAPYIFNFLTQQFYKNILQKEKDFMHYFNTVLHTADIIRCHIKIFLYSALVKRKYLSTNKSAFQLTTKSFLQTRD